jgi:predicted lipoprotein with Yx(FWY)xxD motif
VTRTLPAVAILAIGALLAVTGCGGSSSSSSSSGEGGAYGSGGGETGTTKSAKSETGGGEAAAGGAGAVAVAKSPELGTAILVDSKGFTLYDFHKDKGTQSACYGACAQGWPPLTTSGAPQAMSGAEASKLGTTKRSDGTMQVTYAGHPLYTFVEDTKPGEAKGNDVSAFGAQWYALKSSGEEAGD